MRAHVSRDAEQGLRLLVRLLVRRLAARAPRRRSQAHDRHAAFDDGERTPRLLGVEEAHAELLDGPREPEKRGAGLRALRPARPHHLQHVELLELLLHPRCTVRIADRGGPCRKGTRRAPQPQQDAPHPIVSGGLVSGRSAPTGSRRRCRRCRGALPHGRSVRATGTAGARSTCPPAVTRAGGSRGSGRDLAREAKLCCGDERASEDGAMGTERRATQGLLGSRRRRTRTGAGGCLDLRAACDHVREAFERASERCEQRERRHRLRRALRSRRQRAQALRAIAVQLVERCGQCLTVRARRRLDSGGGSGGELLARGGRLLRRDAHQCPAAARRRLQRLAPQRAERSDVRIRLRARRGHSWGRRGAPAEPACVCLEGIDRSDWCELSAPQVRERALECRPRTRSGVAAAAGRSSPTVLLASGGGGGVEPLEPCDGCGECRREALAHTRGLQHLSRTQLQRGRTHCESCAWSWKRNRV